VAGSGWDIPAPALPSVVDTCADEEVDSVVEETVVDVEVAVVVFCRPSVFQMDGPTELNHGGRGLGVDDAGVAVRMKNSGINLNFNLKNSKKFLKNLKKFKKIPKVLQTLKGRPDAKFRN
jgi:hypothetical protein